MLSCLCARRFSIGPTIHSGKKRNTPPDCLQPIHDSAGKFGMDNWTREAEAGRVKEKDHEDVKEEQDVATRPPARTHSRSDQPDRSREFSQGNPGHACALCA